MIRNIKKRTKKKPLETRKKNTMLQRRKHGVSNLLFIRKIVIVTRRYICTTRL